MTEWELKWDEYCRVTDELAVGKAARNYMDKVEKRMFSLVFREATGNIEERKAAFYGSEEYAELSLNMLEKDELVGRMVARRDQLHAWFELYRTDESSRRAEMGLQR